MVKFYDFPGAPDVEKYRRELITDASDYSSTATLWNVLFHTYFMNTGKLYLMSNFGDAPTTFRTHTFPVLDLFYYITDAESKQPLEARVERLIFVEAMDEKEAMDKKDATLVWDAENSYAYTHLKNVDATNVARKSYGAIAAGTRFVLFEVVGNQAPKYLIGSADKPASFLEKTDREKVEKAMETIKQVAESGLCKSLPRKPKAPASGAKGVRHGNITTSHAQNTIASSSSTGAKQAPSTAKTAASVGARSASPSQATGNAVKSTSNHK